MIAGRLKNVLILMCIYSFISLGIDIVNVYFSDFSEHVTILFHSIHVVLLIFFCKCNSFSLKNKIKKVKLSYVFASIILGILSIVSFDVIEFDYIIEGIHLKNENTSTWSIFFTIYFLIYASFIAPIVEEIEFRGILLLELRKSGYASIVALILSSFMFLAIHTGKINTTAFVLGIVSGLMLYITGNLIYSILIHFSGNFMICLLIFISLLTNKESSNTNNVDTIHSNGRMLFGFIIITFIICLLVYIYIDNKNNNNKLNWCDEKQKNKIKKSDILCIGLYFSICILATVIQYEF